MRLCDVDVPLEGIADNYHLRDELWRGFNDHFGHFEVRDDRPNLFNRNFIKFVSKGNVSAVQIYDYGREQKQSCDEDDDAKRKWKRSEWTVGRLSSGKGNEDSELKDSAKSNPRAG